MSSDVPRAREFYGELFGWSSTTPAAEHGGYVNFARNEHLVAGCLPKQQVALPDLWTVYLASDDAEATSQAAAANGGVVHVPAMTIASLGRMAYVEDSGHASIGIWEPGEHKGFSVFGEPDSPSWFELHTRKYDETVQFYRDVFGWRTFTASDDPGFRYTTLGEGDGRLAGIMDAGAFLSEAMPAHWSIYFGTADCDTSVETILANGGSVVSDPTDTPFGRVAHVCDPMGASFKLVAGM
jgi:predicted enzyme related to lactoylglutathione lyase